VLFAGAVGADDSQDAALFDVQVDAVERDGRAEGFAQAAGFDDGHGLGSSFSLLGEALKHSWIQTRRFRAIQKLFRFEAEALNVGRDPCHSSARTFGVRFGVEDPGRRN